MILVILVGVYWHLISLICVSLIPSDVEQFFWAYWLFIYFSKVSQYFTHFKIG